MEGQQSGDLDPGTGRDTQVTGKGGASSLFIDPFHRQNSRGMLGEAKGDEGVKYDGWELSRSHMHILLSAWITVEFLSKLQVRLPYQ